MKNKNEKKKDFEQLIRRSKRTRTSS